MRLIWIKYCPIFKTNFRLEFSLRSSLRLRFKGLQEWSGFEDRRQLLDRLTLCVAAPRTGASANGKFG